ncbi:hypothetical protein UVI_02016220 [Ustilaginoidea virens]|uniref:C3H1-type domain-containing protein n=1 Tax=Ustilaginoidea virens TaxID=1159556 RepID=A0A1B5KRS3_USTVR|nr:hypothetical protein UVI_02016220 [Ustilaginoidea virens]
MQSNAGPPTSKSSTGDQVTSQSTTNHSEQTHLSGLSHLEDARKQASDTILRLWPFNVRYQTYVEEGVDETLLKSLFKDLGLEILETKRVPEQPRLKSTPPVERPKPRPSIVETKPTKSSTSAAEERKDRIARLLAAKGSKPAPAAALAPVPPVNSAAAEAKESVAKGSKPSLTQSEKSKLLQEKMAALQKAREALQLRKSEHSEGGDSSKSASTPASCKAVNGGGMDVSGISGPGLTASIPESSLPQTRQVVPTPDSVGQPAATPRILEVQHSHAAPAFDRNVESRPFLINVSDDENDEDEEMEIDSPGRPETPSNLPGTPGQRGASLQHPATLSDSAPVRQAGSQASISSPLRTASRDHSGDLESMNKQIEEMKQKIAEAEARKRAKNSRACSPVLSPRNGSSVDGGSGFASHQATPGTPCLEPDPAVRPQPSRRSRSRVASERLPLLEARRREQLEKLKSLQSEVAKIERELEADLVEERRLKRDMLNSDSDKNGDVEDVVVPLLTSGSASTHEGISMAGEPAPQSTDEDEAMPLFEAQDEAPSTRSSDSNKVAHSCGDVGERPDGGSYEAGNLSPGKETLIEHAASSAAAMVDGREDVAMEDTGYSADEDAEAESDDDYEPADAAPPLPAEVSRDDMEMRERDSAVAAEAVPATDQTMLAPDGFTEAADNLGNGHGYDANAAAASECKVPDASRSKFVPYETPLQYFHAYRFHPQFKQTVAGGLRSLTYSNKIDVKKELCPDELSGQQCPRGSRCDFQHFETMQAPGE